MSEELEAGMLAAIEREPEDDALRSVYADWLEERGDPRGEYLRLEIAAHGRGELRVPPRDASALARGIPAAWLDAIARRFDVVLVASRDPHIHEIKAVRMLTRVGLAEGKRIAESARPNAPQLLVRDLDRARADAVIADYPNVALVRRPRHPFSP